MQTTNQTPLRRRSRTRQGAARTSTCSSMTGATAERAPQRHQDPQSLERGGMTRAERIANLIGVVVPFLGLLAAVVLLWQSWVDATDLGDHGRDCTSLCGLGITVGYHRLLTHRAFQTHKPVEYALRGRSARWRCRARVLDWVADHRKHHAHTDQEGDPHSPARRPRRRASSGLWHAHTGWLFETQGQADWKKYAKDLYEDRGMKRINRVFPLLALAEPRASRPSLGFVAARLHARGRAARPGLGRPRARVLPAPRHVVDQLGLPLLRPPPLRRRGPLDQRRLARAAVARRGLAPQPPRVPALGRARPAPVGDRRLRPGHPRHASASGSPGTSCGSRPSASRPSFGALSPTVRSLPTATRPGARARQMSAFRARGLASPRAQPVSRTGALARCMDMPLRLYDYAASGNCYKVRLLLAHARARVRARPGRHLRRRHADRRVRRDQSRCARRPCWSSTTATLIAQSGRDPLVPRRGHAVAARRPRSSARRSPSWLAVRAGRRRAQRGRPALPPGDRAPGARS